MVILKIFSILLVNCFSQLCQLVVLEQMVVITMVIKMITNILDDVDDHHLNIVRLPHQAGVGVAKLSGLLA